MTKIFDEPTEFAADALSGFAAAHGDLVEAVSGGVVRAAAMPEGQVAVVIGGGSGHYPAFAGLVGPGLAAGSACGNLFASPAAAQVHRVAKAAANGGGVLLSYGNYAGDVLHFGQAQQWLNDEGIPTRTVLVTDDIASAPADEMEKRRGIAGDLVVFKIAGAAAETGADLDEVHRLASKANQRTRSLGVAFGGCTMPGAAKPLFTVPEGMMSVGLGIHGEPGISEMPIPSASDLAALLVESLLADTPEDRGSRVAVILNGLGTVKYEELYLLYGRVAELLALADLDIVGPECGELVTSLDMSGLSLTLCWLDDELEPLWLAPAESPAFKRGSTDAKPRRASRVEAESKRQAGIEPSSEASRKLAHGALAALSAMRTVLQEQEQELGRLDAIAGDGDHGIGMLRGAEAAVAAAQTAVEGAAGFRATVQQAGMDWAERAGGTSGALWGAGLSAIANALGERESYGAEEARGAAVAFVDAIMELGKAEPGDKTMLDAMLPARDAFLAALATETGVAEAWTAAVLAARQGASDTAALRPKKGRARPLAERSLGHPDPGAVSFALLLESIAGLFGKDA